jgi:hypothetical protein
MFTLNSNRRSSLRHLALALATAWAPPAFARSADRSQGRRRDRDDKAKTHYRTVDIEGLPIFYREAGPADGPVVLLLHGWPSSSRMFRNLIPQLADRYRVIAPDYPGFGNSAAPDRSAFAYTFDHLGEVMEAFVQALRVARSTLRHSQECPDLRGRATIFPRAAATDADRQRRQRRDLSGREPKAIPRRSAESRIALAGHRALRAGRQGERDRFPDA